MIQAVIFDMDGLLIDSEPFWQETERAIMKNFGIDITSEMQKDTFGLRNSDQIVYWYNYKPWPNPNLSELESSYDRVMLGYFKEKAILLPGVEYILNFFKSKNIKIALASSSNMILIDAFISKFNLGKFFDVANSAEKEKFAKPHPAVYIETALKLDIPPIQCLAFEDSIYGVVSAKAARMKVVAVPDKNHYSNPEYAIANLKIKNLNEFGEKEFQKLNNY